MKNFKLLALVAIFGLFVTTKSNAQIDVSINPIGILFGDLSVGADFVLSDNLSVEGQVGYGSGDLDDRDWSNIPITAVLKYYFSPDKGADKFYADAFMKFVNRNYDADDIYAEYSQTRFGIGFGIGYKVVGKSGFLFDIGFGVGRALVDNTSFTGDGETLEVDWTNIMTYGKLGLGYRFGAK